MLHAVSEEHCEVGWLGSTGVAGLRRHIQSQHHMRTGPSSHMRTGPSSHMRPGPSSHMRPGPSSHMRRGPSSHMRPGPSSLMWPGPSNHKRHGPEQTESLIRRAGRVPGQVCCWCVQQGALQKSHLDWGISPTHTQTHTHTHTNV